MMTQQKIYDAMLTHLRELHAASDHMDMCNAMEGVRELIPQAEEFEGVSNRETDDE